MYDERLIILAMNIASRAHREQKDKQEQPYIGHLVRVAKKLDSIELKAVALLYDVIEDTDISAEDLIKEGMPKHLVLIVEILTHDKRETYAEHINRVAKHPGARLVKLADIADNLDPKRLEALEPEQVKYLKEKYGKAQKVLEHAEAEAYGLRIAE